MSGVNDTCYAWRIITFLAIAATLHSLLPRSLPLPLPNPHQDVRPISTSDPWNKREDSQSARQRERERSRVKPLQYNVIMTFSSLPPPPTLTSFFSFHHSFSPPPSSVLSTHQFGLLEQWFLSQDIGNCNETYRLEDVGCRTQNGKTGQRAALASMARLVVFSYSVDIM